MNSKKKVKATKNKQTEKALENSSVEKLEFYEIAKQTNQSLLELGWAGDGTETEEEAVKTLKSYWQNAFSLLESLISAIEASDIPPQEVDFFANGLKNLDETRNMFKLFEERGETLRFISSGMFSAFQKNTSEIMERCKLLQCKKRVTKAEPDATDINNKTNKRKDLESTSDIKQGNWSRGMTRNEIITALGMKNHKQLKVYENMGHITIELVSTKLCKVRLDTMRFESDRVKLEKYLSNKPTYKT